MQRADTSCWNPFSCSVSLQAEGGRAGGRAGKGRPRFPTVPGGSTSDAELPAGELHVSRGGRCGQVDVWGQRSGWIKSPEERPSEFCPNLALGLGGEGLTCVGPGMLSRLCSLPWTSRMLSCSARTVPTSHVSNSWGPGRLPFNPSVENRHVRKRTQEVTQLGKGGGRRGQGRWLKRIFMKSALYGTRHTGNYRKGQGRSHCVL